MGRKLLYMTLVLAVICIGVLHFITPAELIFYHNTYRRLSYFPIVLGGIWFGLQGGLSLAALSSIAFIPHLLLFAGHGLQNYYSELSEILLYLLAGAVVGLISGRERKLRVSMEKTSARLAQSYEDLYKGTTQLIEAEEQLAATQKMSVLGEMATNLAHEIRNPLSSIKGTAEILLDDYPKEHPKREFVEILLKETSRLNTTLEQILSYASNSPMKEGGEVSLASILVQQKKLLAPILKKNKVTLELHEPLPGDVFPVDGSRMSQVLLNIFINGIEALKDTPNPRLVVKVLDQERGMRVEIHDNGPGVPDSESEKVFQPFYSTRDDGTGLGLLISRKIVGSFGGTLTLENSSLGGACFTIFLPRQGRSDSLNTFITAGGEDATINTAD